MNTHALCLLKLQSFISNRFFFFSCLLSTFTLCVIPSNTLLLLSLNLLQLGFGIPRHKGSTYQMECFCNRAMLGECEIKVPLDGTEMCLFSKAAAVTWACMECDRSSDTKFTVLVQQQSLTPSVTLLVWTEITVPRHTYATKVWRALASES